MGNLQARGFSASFNPVNMAEEILRGDRIALSKAITLTESSREDHRQRAIDLLTILLPNVQRDRPTLRIGIAGPPGAGKSSFM